MKVKFINLLLIFYIYLYCVCGTQVPIPNSIVNKKAPFDMANVPIPSKLMVDPSPLVPMSEYNNVETPGYRVLNCFECFEAQGRMCIDRNYKTLFYKTHSSNEANAICCKLDNFEGYCSDQNQDLVCSMPSYDLN